MKKKKLLKIVLPVLVTGALILLGFVVAAMTIRPVPLVYDYDDPESLRRLAERTEQYIIRSTPDRESPARREALKEMEEIALLDVSDAEKARLIRARFPEESFWNDDMRGVLKAAEAGDAEAQYLLGCFYSIHRRISVSDVDYKRGDCIIKSDAQAAKWFRRAALQGLAKAQFRVGYLYMYPVMSVSAAHPASRNVQFETARIVKLVDRESEEWLAKAGKQGDPDAILHRYGPDGKYDDVREARAVILPYFRKLAEQGDVAAMLRIGEVQDLDNPRESAAWYLKAAEHGSVLGMLRYADELEYDDGDGEKAALAKQWRRKAFEVTMKHLDEGDAEDAYHFFLDSRLLKHLEDCIGGEDKGVFLNRLIMRLWDLIEQHGDYLYSRRIIETLLYFLCEEERTTPDPETMYRRGSELGYFEDQYHLAEATLLKPGTPQEEQAEARRIIRILAGLGYVHAQARLGEDYFNGSGVPQDKAEAVKWMRQAALQYHYTGTREISRYLIANGSPVDLFEALNWYFACRALPYDTYAESLIRAGIEETVGIQHGIGRNWDGFIHRIFH